MRAKDLRLNTDYAYALRTIGFGHSQIHRCTLTSIGAKVDNIHLVYITLHLDNGDHYLQIPHTRLLRTWKHHLELEAKQETRETKRLADEQTRRLAVAARFKPLADFMIEHSVPESSLTDLISGDATWITLDAEILAQLLDLKLGTDDK